MRLLPPRGDQTAVDLLSHTAHRTDADIDAIENIGRRGTYGSIRNAIMAAGTAMSGRATAPVGNSAVRAGTVLKKRLL